MDRLKDLKNVSIDQAKSDLSELQKKWKIADFKTSKISQEVNLLKLKVEVVASENEENKKLLTTLKADYEDIQKKSTITFIQINKVKVAFESKVHIINKYMKYMEPQEKETVAEVPNIHNERIELDKEMEKIMVEIQQNSLILKELYLQVSNINV